LPAPPRGKELEVTGAFRPARVAAATLLFSAIPVLYGPLSPSRADLIMGARDEGIRIPVLVALETFPTGPGDSAKAEAAWLQRLERRLEDEEGGSAPVRVVERFILERGPTAAEGAGTDEARLQAVAHSQSASFVVLGSLTQLADRYSLDVRLLAVDGTADPIEERVFEGEGIDGLAEIFDRAAETVRRWVADAPAPAPAPPGPVPPPVARPDTGAPVEVPVPDPQAVSAPPRFPAEPPVPAEEIPGVEPQGDPETVTPGLEPEIVIPGLEPVDPPEATPEEDAIDQRAEPPSEPGPSAEGPPVVEIRVVGNRRIEADAIRGRVATRVGEPFDAARTREDLRRVFDLGFFRDVQVLASDHPDGKVVTFVVEENPIIRQVSVIGNDAVSGDEIREQLTLTVGSTIDYPLLLENEQRIEALYQAKGYYRAEVDARVEAISDDAVAVKFDIVEGNELHLVEIDFQGNDFLSDGELRKVMQTKPWRFYSRLTHWFDRSGLYAEPIFYQDLDRIRRRYMDEGFIRVRVSEPEVTVNEKEDGLRVVVRIEEGSRFTVGEVDVGGDGSFDRDRLRSLVTLQPGQTFSRSAMTDDVERLRNHYADRGFFFARVEPKTRVDPVAKTIDCRFEVEKGDLYFIEHVRVRGNTRTRDQVVRREIELGEGELYSATALQRSQARVRRLGFFEEVSMETRPLDDPHHVDVDVEVVERPTGSFSFGAGVGSTDGFLVNASIRQENLFGKGYQLTANVDFGSDNSNVYVRFTDPYIFGTAASLSTTVFQYEREYLDFDQNVFGFDVTTGYPLDEGDTRGFAGYSFTAREVTGDIVQASSMVQREEFQEDIDTSLASLSFRRDLRDDARFPKSGHVTGFAMEFAGLGGLSQFLRLEGRTTWFFPVKKWLGFESTFIVNSRAGYVFPFNDISDFDLPQCTSAACDAWVAASNGETQSLTNIDDDLELPISERYFLGGVDAFQVRGFRQRSLGPRRSVLYPFNPTGLPGDLAFTTSDRDQAGGCLAASGECNSLKDTDIDDFEDLDLTDVIGRHKFFLLNLELQFPIAEELGLVGIVFFDMGNAFAEDEAINPADLRFGTGAGLQWFSPFGPILVQLGIPLDPLEDEDNTVFEFSMGGSTY
jgi:outer membrane protein insertion porin family